MQQPGLKLGVEIGQTKQQRPTAQPTSSLGLADLFLKWTGLRLS